MPLSKKRMRERKRIDRGVKPKSNLNTVNDVKPNKDKLAELRGIINTIHTAQAPVQSVTIPVYNPSIHRPGDRVLVKQYGKWIETIVPELDADGHQM